MAERIVFALEHENRWFIDEFPPKFLNYSFRILLKLNGTCMMYLVIVN